MTEFYLKGCTLGANGSASGSLIPAPQLKESIPGTTCPSGASEPLNFLNVVVTVPSTGGSVEWYVLEVIFEGSPRFPLFWLLQQFLYAPNSLCLK